MPPDLASARLDFDQYVTLLEPFLATGKPVIVTEFGMRTFRGAESSGALGFGVTDTTRLWLGGTPCTLKWMPRLCLPKKCFLTTRNKVSLWNAGSVFSRIRYSSHTACS